MAKYIIVEVRGEFRIAKVLRFRLVVLPKSSHLRLLGQVSCKSCQEIINIETWDGSVEFAHENSMGKYC